MKSLYRKLFAALAAAAIVTATPVEFNIDLEKYVDGNWEFVDSTTETYTEKGVYMLEGSCSVSKGTYHSVATATAYNDYGVPLRTLQAVSPSKSY